MHFSKRFLSLVQELLTSFETEAELENVVVYVAQTNDGDSPTLEVVGQMTESKKKVLPPIANDPDLRAASPNRRWYPLQDGSILLGVIRVEKFSSEQGWPESLDKRFHASAALLSNSLSLELDRKRLVQELTIQKEQIGMLVHQLRNPLAALKTYAQLLLRKLGPESQQRSLVEGLIAEQAQLDKYLVALDELSQLKEPGKALSASRLLLPPQLPNAEYVELKALLKPLIDRASATASFQGRKWFGPSTWPKWLEQSRPASEGLIAEIVANLLENAFRYSPVGSALGIAFSDSGLCVWDSGRPISEDEREKIFSRGYRSSNSFSLAGSGLGLTLGKELAEQLGGKLYLNIKPKTFDQSLPEEGNAFVLKLPVK